LRLRIQSGIDPSSSANFFSDRRLSRRNENRRRHPGSVAGKVSPALSAGRPSVAATLAGLTSDP
jgi:hypothetical protein